MTDNAQNWIGRQITTEDIITPRLVDSLRATFAPHLCDAAIPVGVIWCLCPDIEPASSLGADGHPMRGLHLPDLGFERRMWAGGQLQIYQEFTVNQPLTRTSTIKAITPKSGKSGEMVFLTIAHEFHQNDQLICEDIQNLVYRQAVTSPVAGRPLAEELSADNIDNRWSLCPDSTMLFRYSALSFNGHRIHYDEAYAKTEEGHEGLVVHGPIQASLMLSLAQKTSQQKARIFQYRALSPLICGTPIDLFYSRKAAKDGFDAKAVVATKQGRVTMTADIGF